MCESREDCTVSVCKSNLKAMGKLSVVVCMHARVCVWWRTCAAVMGHMHGYMATKACFGQTPDARDSTRTS